MPATTVEKTLVSRKIILAIPNGTTASGTAKIANRTFNNVNPDADEEAMYAVGAALGSVMKNGLSAVYFDDKSLLAAEAND